MPCELPCCRSFLISLVLNTPSPCTMSTKTEVPFSTSGTRIQTPDLDRHTPSPTLLKEDALYRRSFMPLLLPDYPPPMCLYSSAMYAYASSLCHWLFLLQGTRTASAPYPPAESALHTQASYQVLSCCGTCHYGLQPRIFTKVTNLCKFIPSIHIPTARPREKVATVQWIIWGTKTTQ